MSSSEFWRRRWPDRSYRARFGVVLLALVLAWQWPFPVIAQQPACGSFAVAIAPQSAGHPLSENEVRLVEGGDEVARFAASQPGRVFPSSRSNVAILRSLGGIFSLLDTATGAVTLVQIPEDQQPLIGFDLPTYRNAANADFMLFASGPLSVWLVDMRSGQAVDLRTVLPNDGLVESAAIAPGGEWVEFFSRGSGYLISLKSPAKPIELSGEPMLPYPAFDADGGALIYATRTEAGVSISSRDLASGVSTLIGNVPAANYLDAASSDIPLLIDAQSLLKIPRSGPTTPERLYTWQGATLGIIGDTTGRYLLVGDDRREDGAVWSWVDTEAGITTELDELTGMIPLPISGRQDAVTFLPSAQQGPGTPGAAYRTVDLATGNVATALIQDSIETWMYAPAGDTAGRYTLVDAVSPGMGRMWLIDNVQGSAAMIGRSPGNLSARVSPDGCQIAVATFDTVGEGRTSVVTVSSLLDGSTIATIPDALLLGWASVPARP